MNNVIRCGLPICASLCLCLAIPPITLRADAPSFAAQTIDDDIQIGYGVVVGRVDNDEHPDILLADKTEIVWYRNPGKRDVAWTRHIMAKNLTARDNVCLAARDLNGDGLVEVAVGANWNPGNTSDREQSGAVFYLKRPADPAQAWSPVTLTPHDPTVHRMRWIQADGEHYLAVLPLHGVGNKQGDGDSVHIQLHKFPGAPDGEWTTASVDTQLHMTHNFELRSNDAGEMLVVGGREGVRAMNQSGTVNRHLIADQSRGVGEIRRANLPSGRALVVIEPMHGNEVVVYQRTGRGAPWQRKVLDSDLKQGHAVSAADFLGRGNDQVVAGWRNPNSNGKVGIRMYVPGDSDAWQTFTIDDNVTACEDLKAVDLDGDSQPDILAAGRSSKNLIVYWNDRT